MKMTGMAVMVVAAVSGRAGASPTETRQLTICMENFKGTIEKGARAVASGIFAGIGVQIQWRGPDECPTEAIYVSFSNETSVNEHRDALAYALPYEGTHIVVFLDRVKSMAPALSSVACLLGYTLTHEVTHILEGQVRHSESGIMKARWEANDHFEMRRRRLGFAAQDISMIHHGLDWRESRLAMASASNPAAELVAAQ